MSGREPLFSGRGTMFERSRKVSVILAPHRSSKSWSRVVPLPVLLGIGVVSLALVLGFFMLLLQVAELSSQAREVASLREENAALRDQVRRVDGLEAEVIRLQELETRIRRWAGIEPNAESMRSEPGRQVRWEREDELLEEIPALSPVEGWISRGFEAGPEGHPGIDFVGETGTPVRASAVGVVRFAGWDEDLGRTVVLDHGNGFTTRYGHNDSLLVNTGDPVSRGDVVATLGNTGRSSAPHVHFEVRLEEELIDPSYLLAAGF
jgi:murein DD-endopeptidase MepM/ murein hydrolase activator NlpD